MDVEEVRKRKGEAGVEVKIMIDHSSFENQTNRLVTELGLSKIKAENISKIVRDLAEEKINEQGKNWSKTVRKEFANLMTAILIEGIKTGHYQECVEK